MGKTNYAILGIGLAACVLLSLMMQSALRATQETKKPEIVRALQPHYSFEKEPEYSVTTADNGGRIAELVIYPQLSSSARRLVRGAGEFVWRHSKGDERFDVLLVVVDLGNGKRTRYQVPSPNRVGASIRFLAGSEEPKFPRGWRRVLDKTVAGSPLAEKADPESAATATRPESRPAAAGGDDAPGAGLPKRHPSSRPAGAKPAPK